MTVDGQADEQLFKAFRRGKIEAFDELYARYRQTLYLFLLRRGHPESVAEDLFHDAWMKVIDHKDRFDDGNFRAWIFSIVRNLSTDAFRREFLRPVTEQEGGSGKTTHFSAQQVIEDVDCLDLIKSSVAALPLEQRDVFLLKEEAGLSLQQLADIMAVGRETIKSRLRYAMKQLKQLMADCL